MVLYKTVMCCIEDWHSVWLEFVCWFVAKRGVFKVVGIVICCDLYVDCMKTGWLYMYDVDSFFSNGMEAFRLFDVG
jgi:hypothetical protein